jgi:hypothetical protein
MKQKVALKENKHTEQKSENFSNINNADGNKLKNEYRAFI